jgi:hypothetical protein
MKTFLIALAIIAAVLGGLAYWLSSEISIDKYSELVWLASKNQEVRDASKGALSDGVITHLEYFAIINVVEE